MEGYVYKTTNLENSCYYIGSHASSEIDTSYLGSGEELIKAIKHFGKDKFRVEIIKKCNTIDEMLRYERSLITEEMVASPHCYNMSRGYGRPKTIPDTFKKYNFKLDRDVILKFRGYCHSEGLSPNLQLNAIISDFLGN